MADAEEIAEQFLMELAMLRPERRTFELLADFVFHQIISLNNEELRNDVLELMVPRIEQEFLQPQPQPQPQPQLASPLMEPELPQLPPSPAASTVSINSAETIEPLNLEHPVVPVIPCILDPPQIYGFKLPIPPPPPGYVNPSRAILRTQFAVIYHHTTPVFMRSTLFDIHVEYQTSPTNGEVQ